MIRQLAKGWFICYDADGKEFDGPFASCELAVKRLQNLRPVDRMLVSGVGPGVMTDSVFMAGHGSGRQFQDRPELGDEYKRRCLKAGGSTLGRRYLSQLARFPGDPEAWVSGRGDVQRVCEKRGWASEGAVSVKGECRVEREPEPIPIAEDIVQKHLAAEVRGQKLSPKKLAAKRDEIRDRLTPRWKKKYLK